jgi:hypothetical protein
VLPIYAQSGSGLNLSLSTEESSNPKVAASGNNVYVVWQENQGEGRDSVADIFFARSTDSGKTFSEPVNLSDSPGRSSIPQVAAAGSSVYVVWGESTPGNSEVFFAKSTDNGASFSEPENISNTGGTSINPKVAVTGSGGIIVAWTESLSLTNFEIFAATSDNGGDSFDDPVNMSDNDQGSSAPALASFGENVYLAWQDDLSGNLDIVLAKSTDGGKSFDDAVNISNTAGRSSAPQIAANDDDVYILWQEDNTIRLAGSNDWGSTFRSPTTVGDADSVQKPQIAASGSSVIVASGGDDGDIMVVRSSDSGATLSPPINVSNNHGDSASPAIALSGSVTYLAWQDSASGNGEILFTYSVDGGVTFLPIGTEAGEEETRPITRLPTIPAECTTQNVIRTTSLSVTNAGDSEASVIYLHFPEGIRWVFMPGYDRFRISDNTIMLVADQPLAPNRSTEMLFVPDDLDLDIIPDPEPAVGIPRLQGIGVTVGVECDPDIDVLDGDDSTASLPSIMMGDPRLSFAQSLIGGQVPILSTLVLDLPQIPLADLPDEFEVEVDCETDSSPSDPEPGVAEARLQGDGVTVGVGVTEGVTVGIDELEVDGMSIDSADSGLPLPADLFPIQIDPIDAELEGELQGDIDDSFIEFIPAITRGSIGFNDKIEIKMHYDGEPGDATISPRAIVTAPLGTSCTMSIESPQANEGLTLPFTFDSTLELPAGESTITIEPQCETDGCSIIIDNLFMTIETPTTGSIIPECLINDIVIDGVSLDIPPIPLPPNKKVDVSEAGTREVEIDGSLSLEMECSAEAPGEARIRGDAVGDAAADVDVIGVGE